MWESWVKLLLKLRRLTFILGRYPVWGLPGDLVVENPPANIGDTGSIPGLGGSPGGGNGNPLQYSCLENPRDGGAWWAAVYGVTQSRTQLKWFSSSSTSLKSQCHLCTFKIQSLLFCIILLYNEKLVTGFYCLVAKACLTLQQPHGL